MMFKRFGLAAILLAAAIHGHSQINSNTASITLNATVAESLTITLSGNVVNWTGLNALTPGAAVNAPDTGVTVTTDWVLRPNRGAVQLYAYFTSLVALAATSGDPSSVDIPTSAFEINSPSLGASTPVNQDHSAAVPGSVPGSSLLLRSTVINGSNRNSSTSDALSFNIRLDSAAMQQLPADTYLGTLNIVAQATP